jgi:HPt (histidine-containing phosphotransfer) domain-containing protein
MPESVIDQAVFNELKESVGADFVGELVNTFLEEAPGLIAQLRPALAAGDRETFRRAAHSIKSNAATFGAMQLNMLAKELEFMARDDRLGDVGDKVEILETAYQQSIIALKELCR